MFNFTMLRRIGINPSSETDEDELCVDLDSISKVLDRIKEEKVVVVKQINKITSANSDLVNETVGTASELALSVGTSQLLLREKMRHIDDPKVSL